MVDVTISLIGSNGDEIELADNGDFVLASALTNRQTQAVFGVSVSVACVTLTCLLLSWEQPVQM
jgi:hypothetical protein